MKGVRKEKYQGKRQTGKERGRDRWMSWDSQLQRENAIYHPDVLSTAGQTSGFWETFGRYNAPFTAQTTVTVLLPLSLCVCVYPFQAFLWSNYKGLFSGWGDVTLTTKAYISCY